MLRPFSIASLIISVTCSMHAAEAEVVAENEKTVDETDEVIVISATRSEVVRQRSPTVVDVVELEDLRLRGTPIRTQDQLRHIPGLSFEQNFGGFAGGGGVYIRGGRSHQTQFLIDGVPFNDASSGQGRPGHHLFILPGLQRIEVAKGAQSGIYGSGASAGAVDLQVLRPTQETSYGGRFEYGSFDTVSGSVQTTGMITEEIGYAVAANHLSSDGVSAQTSTADEGDPKGFEKDSFDRKAISARLSWENDFTEVFVSGLLMDSDSDFDASGNPDDTESNTKQQSIRVHGGVRTALTDTIDLDADLSYTTYDRRLKGTPDNLYYSNDFFGSLRTTFAVHEGIDITTAVDYRKEEADINGFGTLLDDSEHTIGLWVQAEVDWDDLTGQFVVRRDEHSREGDATTYRIGLSYAVCDDWVIHASTGTGFRAPSLFELYSQYGNLELEPEENVTYDLGHRLNVTEAITVEQTLFYIGWDEAIRWVSGQYQNVAPVDNAYVYGIENTITYQPTDSLELGANFTWQNSDDGSSNSTEMTRVARFTGGVLGTYQQTVAGKPAWFTAGVEYQGRRFSNASNTTELPGIVNLRAAVGFQPSDEVTVTLRGENLTNELEPTSKGSSSNWTSVPLAVYLGVEASF